MIPGFKKIVVFGKQTEKYLDITHAIRQIHDGSWYTQDGPGPLIRILNPDLLIGSYGDPKRVYTKTRRSPIGEWIVKIREKISGRRLDDVAAALCRLPYPRSFRQTPDGKMAIIETDKVLFGMNSRAFKGVKPLNLPSEPLPRAGWFQSSNQNSLHLPRNGELVLLTQKGPVRINLNSGKGEIFYSIEDRSSREFQAFSCGS